MEIRSCPVCGIKNSDIIMRFAPDLICENNSTYKAEIFKEVVKGKEEKLTYSHCKNCSMVYCENYWSNEILKRIYEEVIIHEKSKLKSLLIRKRLGQVQNWKNVISLMLLMGKKQFANIKVIDYGCGWGDLMDVVRCEGVNVLGFDKYGIYLNLEESKSKYFVNSTEELESFGPVDVIFLMSVVEHLQEPNRVFSLAKKLLKKDGIIAVRVMDYRSGFIRKNMRRINKNLPALSKNLNPIEHVNLYNYNTLMSTLKNHDFILLSTGNILRLSDFGIMRKGLKIIKHLNRIERVSTKLITGKDLMITAYATNKE